MPIPIIKVGITVVRLFSRPFVSVQTRRMANDPTKAEKKFFRWFGLRCYYWDGRVDAFLANQNMKDGHGLKHVPVDLEKVSEGAAIQRGIEYFCEFVFFYGLLMALAIYELNKRNKDAILTAKRIKGLESKQ